jgi:tripartite-type tricarboxylate transporter receptor subunit TctC
MRAASIVPAFALALACGPALAQVFPSKPMRIIVSTSPGGLTDLLARTTGQAVNESVGQPVVVEYRPGAGTLIGMAACAKSPPDGYTLCITTPESLVYNPLLFSKLPYDPENDFAPVTVLAHSYGMIVAHESVKAHTFPDVLAQAKAQPGALSFATWGAGSIPGIYLGWINHQNGVQITAIPYKGAGAATPAIVGGQVQLTYTAIGLVRSHLKTGRLKADGGHRRDEAAGGVARRSHARRDEERARVDQRVLAFHCC